MALSTAGLTRMSARRPWLVIAAWVILLAGAIILQGRLSDALTNEVRFTTEPESVRGANVLEERFRGPRPVIETVVVTSTTATVDDPAFQEVVQATTRALGDMDIVAQVVNYYQAQAFGLPIAGQLVSEDRHTTIIPVTMTGGLDEVDPAAGEYLETIERLGRDGFRVLTVGDLSASEIYGEIAQEDLETAEIVGLPIALLILIVVFGALIAAGVPLIVALISIIVTVGLAAIVGQFFALSDLVLNVITMIGLAVGIDYTLLIVQRYREERQRGYERRDAIVRTGGTATKSVVFSGFAVVIALAGIFIVPVSVFRSIGAGAVLVVLVSVLASLTLVPAILSLLGDRINWPRRWTYDADTAARREAYDRETIHHGFWGRVTAIVTAHPVVSLLLSSGLLIALSIPFSDLRTGQVGIETYPESTVKSAFEILEEDFYAGIVAPVEVVVEADAEGEGVQEGIEDLIGTLAADPAFGLPTVETNEVGDVTLLSVPLAVESTTEAGENAIEHLREDYVPAAFAGTSAEVFVSGAPAFNYDFNLILDTYTPIVFVFVLGLSFILLTLAFRSIVVPVKAILMNLLSVGAAYGVLVLVFQEGYGADLLGFQQTPVISSWIPIFLFSILFGLSMDYHVFLLSRVREHYDLTHRNRESVAVGLQATGRIITGAALIMVVVFSAFAAGRLVELQQIGLGLAVAIFLDATIVRSVLVPSAMALLGDLNWYLPSWLSWLPDLSVEGESHGHRALKPAPDAASED